MAVSGERSDWKLEAGNEWVARDPFGNVKKADISDTKVQIQREDGVRLSAARNGYTSCRLWVTGQGSYRLAVDLAAGIEADLFRGWYHRMADDVVERSGCARYYVDALVPMDAGTELDLPNADNRVEGQTCQEFWLDLFVPADTAPGVVRGTIRLESGQDVHELPVHLDVLEATIPDEDYHVCNSHSYGCEWVKRMYPETIAACKDRDEYLERVTEILHHYFRLCYEHRGLFTNRGHGHAGECSPLHAPTVEGSGKNRKITDWTLFDRFHAPLLDGSAFAATAPGVARARRPAKPISALYTPFNPDWPANYLWWGQPGYEEEFVRCARQIDAHFREKGWTTSMPFFFVVHKKRYRWFEWDGDEPKDAIDDPYFEEMGRLWNKAMAGSPVPWSFRIDASWRIKDHMNRFADFIDYWVCGGFIRWYPDEVKKMLDRGHIVWAYSGTPGIHAPSSGLLETVYKMWGRGLSGHCQWCAFSPGPDPWFNCNGAATGTMYPGERFGIAGPIPSIRLKLQRNGAQDVNLLSSRADADDLRTTLAETVPVALWTKPPRVVREEPPEVWDSRNLNAEGDASVGSFAERLDPLWWVPIREAAQQGGQA
jgi:hypothetical protein